jgi:hypothetical protein
MKVLVEAHTYELENFEKKDEKGQVLQFIQKEPVGDSLVTISDGTTNEEVIEVLINRLQFLNSKFPCKENAVAITNLEQALMWLEKSFGLIIKKGGFNLKEKGIFNPLSFCTNSLINGLFIFS